MAAIASTSRTAEELFLPAAILNHPQYEWSRLAPQSGAVPIVLSDASPEERTYSLPIEPYNLAKSYITGIYNIAAQGAGNYTWTHAGVPPISEIYLTPVAGSTIVDGFGSHSLMEYLDTIQSFEMTESDYESQDAMDRFRPSDVAAEVRPEYAAATSLNLTPYREPKRVERSAANTAVALRWRLDLGRIANTIFSLNKTLFWGQTMYLRIVFAPINRFAWFTGAADDAFTGAATPVGGANISDPGLYIAKEKDMDVRQSIIHKVTTTGMELQIPTVSLQRTTQAAATTHNVSIYIPASKGYKLCRVIHTAFPSAAHVYNQALNHTNVGDTGLGAATKVTSYSTTLNTNRVQPEDIKCDAADHGDWSYHKDLFKGTAMLNRNMYRYKWVHVDRWDGKRRRDHNRYDIPGDNFVSGLDMGPGHNWGFNAVTPGAVGLMYNTWYVTMQRLIITPGDVQLRSDAPARVTLETPSGAPVVTVSTVTGAPAGYSALPMG